MYGKIDTRGSMYAIIVTCALGIVVVLWAAGNHGIQVPDLSHGFGGFGKGCDFLTSSAAINPAS